MSCIEEVYDVKFEIIHGPTEERSFEMYRAELWFAAHVRQPELQLHEDLMSEHIEVNMEMIHMVEYVRQNAPPGTLELFHCPYTSAEFWIHRMSKPLIELVDQYVQSSPCQNSIRQDDVQLSGDEMSISEVTSPTSGPPICYYDATNATDQRFAVPGVCDYENSAMDADGIQTDRQSNFQPKSLPKQTDSGLSFCTNPPSSNLVKSMSPDRRKSPPPQSDELTDVVNVNRRLPGFRTILQCGDSTVFGNDVPSVLGTPAEASRIRQLYRSSDAFLSHYPAQSPACSKIDEQVNTAMVASSSGKPKAFDFFYDPEVKTQEHSQQVSSHLPAAGDGTSVEGVSHQLATCAGQKVSDGVCSKNVVTCSSFSTISSKMTGFQQVLRSLDNDKQPSGLSFTMNDQTGIMSQSAAAASIHSNIPGNTGLFEVPENSYLKPAVTISSSLKTVPLLSRMRASLLNASAVFEEIGENVSTVAPSGTDSTTSNTGSAMFGTESPTRRFTEFITELPVNATWRQKNI